VHQRAPGCSPRHWTLHRFVADFYSYWLSLLPVKLFVLLLNAAVLLLGILGCSRVVLGLELTDVIPRGTAAYAFLEARATYFSFYNFNAIVKGARTRAVVVCGAAERPLVQDQSTWRRGRSCCASTARRWPPPASW